MLVQAPRSNWRPSLLKRSFGRRTVQSSKETPGSTRNRPQYCSGYVNVKRLQAAFTSKPTLKTLNGGWGAENHESMGIKVYIPNHQCPKQVLVGAFYFDVSPDPTFIYIYNYLFICLFIYFSLVIFIFSFTESIALTLHIYSLTTTQRLRGRYVNPLGML